MKYEKIYNCKDDAEGAVILGMLSSSGIIGMTRDVEQGDIMNVMSGTTLFGKEIYVPEDEVEQAREIMKDYDSADDKETQAKILFVGIAALGGMIGFAVAMVISKIRGKMVAHE